MRTINKLRLIAGAVLAVIGPNVHAAETLTVDQAVDIALKNNPTIRNAQLEMEKGGDRVAAARTKRLPSLTFDMYGSEAISRMTIEIKEGALGDYPGTGPLPGHDTRIETPRTFSSFAITQIKQPITQLHKINLAIKMNEVGLAADREHQRAVRQAIAREVKAAYFSVLSAESAVNAARAAVETHEEVLREVNVRVSHKTALDADRLDASAKLASMKSSQLTAENGLAASRQQLNYLLGRDLDTPFELTAAAEAAMPLPACAGDCVSDRPDIKEADLQLEQAQLDMRIAKADYIPDVSLTAYHSEPLNIEGISGNTSAGILISYEPLTWGRRGAQIAEKRRTVEQAANSARDKRSAAQLEIATRRYKVTEAAAGLQVRQLEMEAAREHLRVTRARFTQLAARPDEMYAATASLTNASAREQDAISAYWTARADYEKAIGQE